MRIVFCDYFQEEEGMFRLFRIIPSLTFYWNRCPDCGGLSLGVEIAWLTLELGFWFGGEENDDVL
jgi:hypothetical protein